MVLVTPMDTTPTTTSTLDQVAGSAFVPTIDPVAGSVFVPTIPVVSTVSSPTYIPRYGPHSETTTLTTTLGSNFQQIIEAQTNNKSIYLVAGIALVVGMILSTSK